MGPLASSAPGTCGALNVLVRQVFSGEHGMTADEEYQAKKISSPGKSFSKTSFFFFKTKMSCAQCESQNVTWYKEVLFGKMTNKNYLVGAYHDSSGLSFLCFVAEKRLQTFLQIIVN